ncbi:MAG: DinB family protein [Thermomicrobiales bacterium]|nr:DinB family protein [Thermomicrobiales bacterium]
MSATTPVTVESIVNALRSTLKLALEECFEKHHGYMLDPDEHFFATLDGISAAEASAPVSSNGTNIAAQVNHTRFYIDAILDTVRTGEYKKLDWNSSWQIGAVDDAEWQALIAGLRRAYDEVISLAAGFDDWNEETIGGAVGLVAHSMFHLGQIREGIAVVRDRGVS